MIRFCIPILILLFQACAPKSKGDNLFVALFQGNVTPTLHGNSVSSDENSSDENLNPDPEKSEEVELPEWTVLNGKSPGVLTMRSRLAVDKNNGFVYVISDVDGNLYLDERTQRLFPTRNLVLKKYNSKKKIIWTKEFGLPGVRLKVGGIAVDWKGNLYATGTRMRFLEEGENEGNEKMLLLKFDSAGNLLWEKQVGVPGAYNLVVPTAITADVWEDVYVAGTTNAPFGGSYRSPGNAFIIKFNRRGEQIWLKQLSIQATDIIPGGLILDRHSMNVYMVGTARDADFKKRRFTGSEGNTRNYSLFVLKYKTANGEYEFFAQRGGTRSDHYEGNAIAVDRSGDVIVGGRQSEADPNTGKHKGYVGTLMKFNTEGKLQWTRKIGKGDGELKVTDIDSIDVDRKGNIFTTGSTNENVEKGEADSVGVKDVFVSKHSTSGDKEWVRQIGATPGQSLYGTGIGTDSNGNLYCVGSASGGVLNGLSVQGGIDQFVLKLRD
ncbi:SBBP repeat beta-propeller lipoprotein, LipL53 family [Leptospira alstonii]|nr:SBBP repeat-containing protein [Leptospira alstonii]